jgi:hypothetical protein
VPEESDPSREANEQQPSAAKLRPVVGLNDRLWDISDIVALVEACEAAEVPKARPDKPRCSRRSETDPVAG